MKKYFAKQLRAHSTDAEAVLWYNLRNRRFFGYKFRRQMAVGKYIVDFVCLERMLVIEVDGGQHAEQLLYDTERTKALVKRGFNVIRFWNNEVLSNLDGVLSTINEYLN
jgi:very-short-patch-repair endonuclease